MQRSRPSSPSLAPGAWLGRLVRSPDAWILIVGALFYAALASRGRFAQPDFHAYYGAAARFLAGQPLYFITAPAPYVPYLYMPTVALLFAPFLLASLASAAIAWYAINVLLLVALRRLLRRQCGDPGGARLALFFLAIGFTLERELSVGNLNLLTLVAGLLAISLAASERWALAGLALACSVVAKPPVGLLALPMLARRRLLLPAALAFAALLAVPVVFYGLHGALALYGEFLRSTADFHRRFADSFKYRSTTAGLWESLLGLAGLRTHHHWSGLIVQYALAAATIIAAYRRTRGGLRALYVALALAPLTALSDYQVFMLAAPLVYDLLCEWRTVGWSRGRLALFLAALALFGGNWHDLWGDRLSKAFFDSGLQGPGTWALIALALSAGTYAGLPPPVFPRVESPKGR